MLARTVAIINYGMGNIGSLVNALKYLKGEHRVMVSGDRAELGRADAFILPGVGAFPAAMENLRQLDLVEELTRQVLIKKKPFLGICLGMQLLAIDSVEQGFATGLGWIKGHVVELNRQDGLRIPHVGWNNVEIVKPDPMFPRIDPGAHFFFDHSFHFRCEEEVIAATFEYGDASVAAIQKDNILATQFHPEKSQRNGLKLLRNFLNFINASS